jgi:hypothetical protein
MVCSMPSAASIAFTGLSLSLVAACASPRKPVSPPGPPGTPVRAEFVDGIVLLEVSLDGRPGWWILDSGYEYSLLDSATAHAAGIAVSTPAAVAQPGGSVTQGWARSVPLDVSGNRFLADSLAAFALTPLAPVVGKPLAGLLGNDFFERHVITIDYARREVLLASPGDWTLPDSIGRRTIVPLWLEAGEPFIEATFWVAGRTVPARLKLDTGSLSGLGLNGSFVAQNRLFPEGWPRRSMEGIAVGGATRNFVGRLDSMALGGFVIPQPVAGWSEDLTRVGDAGTLGAPNLARFRVTFDYARYRMILEPTPEVAARETWEAAGVLLVQVPGGDVIVAQVLPGTPADSAGLLAGDVVRSVGGLEAGKAGLDSMRRHFRTPGTIDTLVISRRGTTRTVSLRQRELP